jgi:hypothetical protein
VKCTLICPKTAPPILAPGFLLRGAPMSDSADSTNPRGVSRLYCHEADETLSPSHHLGLSGRWHQVGSQGVTTRVKLYCRPGNGSLKALVEECQSALCNRAEESD